MAFLFQDQNQGIRNDAPRGLRLRTLTVGFGITPNLLTLFPEEDFKRREQGARGLGSCLTLTAGGDFHPALRTSAARYERPGRNYGEWRLRQQGLQHGESACPHAHRARLRPARACEN